MQFLVDECAGPNVAAFLEDPGHRVFSVYSQDRGAQDIDILAKAFAEKWILITADKDFGELIYRAGKPHCGVVLLRLSDESSRSKASALHRLLLRHADRLQDCYVVVTEEQVRFARPTNEPPGDEQ